MPTSRAALRRWIAASLLVAGSTASTLGTAHADTHVSGSITANTTWTLAGSPYVVDSTVIVREEATLTIEPGVVIKVAGQFTTVTIYGILNAIGTATSRITFTSLQDDSVAGDSAGDGPTEGTPGQWYSLRVRGSAVLRYVDVRFAGYGSANHAYGGVNVYSSGTVDMDYCHVYFNQRSGLLISADATAIVKHSVFTQNAIGVSSIGGVLQISGNSQLSANSHTGLFLNYLSTYTGPPPSISNSEVANNVAYGVRLQVASTIGAASAPVGHENNIFNNGSGTDQRQLSTLYLLTQSSWTNNYWGPVTGAVACPWSPPDTPQMHLTYATWESYCLDPGDGPVKNYVYQLVGGCPANKPQKCASDFVTNFPYSVNPIDNSAR